MKIARLLAICFAFCVAASVGATSLSVHTTIFCQSDSPPLSASFEVSEVSQTTKACPFLVLTGTVTAQQQSDWQSSMNTLQGTPLRKLPNLVQTIQGLRSDESDSQGRIRRSTWIWGADIVNQVALFDEHGHILQLDRWKNQRRVPQALVPAYTCPQTVTRPIPTHMFDGVTGTGQSDAEVFSLGCLADKLVYACLVHDLGLPTDSCTPAGLHFTDWQTVFPLAPGFKSSAPSPTEIPTLIPTGATTFASTVTPRLTPIASAPSPTEIPTSIPTRTATFAPTMTPRVTPTISAPSPTEIPTSIPNRAAMFAPAVIPRATPTPVHSGMVRP